MGRLQVQRRPSRVPQIGDMRDRVALYQRDITAPVFGTPSFTELYTLIDTVWAGVTTFQGPTTFDEVNTKKNINIEFKIRYRADVTTETVIGFDGKHYKIIDPNDMDKRSRFLFIRCTLLGDEDLEANQ